MNKYYAIKGFDKDLKCRDFQFEIGKSFSLPDKPKLGRNGFHFCKTIDDAKGYYPEKSSRFCIIEVLGEVDEGKDKSSTNCLKVVRELSQSDLNDREPSAEMLSRLNNMGFIIGGSMALKIYGYDINRDIKEVDLIVNDIKISDKLATLKTISRNSGIDSVKCYVGLFGEKYDIIQQNKNIEHVTRRYKGFDIKLQDDNEIWAAKLNYALNGSIKHIDDIRRNKIEFTKRPGMINKPKTETLSYLESITLKNCNLL